MARTKFTREDKEIIAKVQGQVVYERNILGFETNEVLGYLCKGPCGLMFPLSHLEVDHIVPLAKGGSDRPSNLQLLCAVCNRKKGSKRRKASKKTTTDRIPLSPWF
jgi:5-methylcytosine-specific restriction endonuclease McrA